MPFDTQRSNAFDSPWRTAARAVSKQVQQRNAFLHGVRDLFSRHASLHTREHTRHVTDSILCVDRHAALYCIPPQSLRSTSTMDTEHVIQHTEARVQPPYFTNRHAPSTFREHSKHTKRSERTEYTYRKVSLPPRRFDQWPYLPFDRSARAQYKHSALQYPPIQSKAESL